MPTNKEISQLFDRWAAVLELLDANRFKINAYKRATRVISDLTVELDTLTDDIKKLTAIEGVGKGLAEKIIELVTTGEIAEFNESLKDVPTGVLAMMDISGLGPKTVATFWKVAEIESVEVLKERIENGSLESLPRMGKKSLEKIRKAIEFSQSSSGRVRRSQATKVAETFLEAMRATEHVERAEIAGSLRRGRDTIGDVDILVGCDDPETQAEAIGEKFREQDIVTDIIAAGPTKSSVRTDTNLQVDLRIVSTENFGAAQLYFTGSKQHNVRMRERAIKQNLRLNEYGLWADGDEGKPVAAATEKDIFAALDLAYIPPTLREDRGEFDSAADGSLPTLVELEDIKAELHSHTTASDGKWTILELATAAKARGFHTLAITDHSASSVLANGLSAERLLTHIEDIRQANTEIDGITLLAGSEVDILADGTLDYDDEILVQLDLVVASPHAALTQEPAKATARLLKAIANPYVHIIGHPTGRIINKREGLSPDMPALIEAAAENGTALEINANDRRLDLRDTHARAAIEAGVKLAINTDAHALKNLDHLPHGLITAQRAWAEPGDVVNCMGHDELQTWLKAKRPG